MSDWMFVSTPNCLTRPRHHLWPNKGWWYLVVTMYNVQTRQSVKQRYNLHTKDIDIAMRRRDKALHVIVQTYGQTVYAYGTKKYSRG